MKHDIKVEGKDIEKVNIFKYLVGIIRNRGMSGKYIKNRTNRQCNQISLLIEVGGRGIAKEEKSFVKPIFTHTSES